MAIMDMGMAQKHKYIVITALLIIPSLVYSKEWTFDPSIKINETYSDNVNFANQRGDSSFVTQTAIVVDSSYRAQHLSYNLNAESTYATYTHDHNIDNNYLTLNGNFNFQLWPNGLALRGSANVQNSPINSQVNQYADIISGDTIQNEQYSSGLSYQIENNQYSIDSNFMYNISKTEDNIGEQRGYSATLNTANLAGLNHIFWDIKNNYRERENNNRTGRSYQSEIKIGYITPYKLNPFIRYYDEDNSGSLDLGISAESNSYGAGIRWRVAPRFILDLSYNKPLNNKSSTTNGQQDDYYNVNINWQPTNRTTLNASISERFYGDSFNFNLQHKNKRLTNTISYAESVETFTRQNIIGSQTDLFCKIGSEINVNNCFITAPNLTEFSLQPIFQFEIIEDDVFSLNKRLSSLSILALSRTIFTINLNRNDRTNLLTKIKSLTQNADLKISRKVSGYSNIVFSASFTETQYFRDQPQARDSQYRYYKINYNRKLNKTLSFDIGLSHLNRSSNPSVFEYKENRISLELNKVL